MTSTFPWRIVAAITCGVAAAVAALVTTAPFARTEPLRALGAFSTADARARRAAVVIGDPKVSRERRATERARLIEIVRDHPANVMAIRSLGIAAALSGDGARAQRLMRYSEVLSRRDLPTQLWMIEDRVAKEDIAGALSHYDRAMKVSRRSRELLVPILARAAADPEIRPRLSALLRTRPSWRYDLIDGVNATGNADAIFNVLAPLNLDPADPLEGWRFSVGLRAMADGGSAARAAALYAKVNPTGAHQPLRDGDFDTNPVLPPFDWTIADRPDAGGVRESRDGASGPLALTTIATAPGDASIARQLLVLPPGRYRARARIGALPADSLGWPTIDIHCAGPVGRPLATVRASRQTGGAATLDRDFTVPSACQGQWLVINRRGSEDDTGDQPWIDAITISPLTPGTAP